MSAAAASGQGGGPMSQRAMSGNSFGPRTAPMDGSQPPGGGPPPPPTGGGPPPPPTGTQPQPPSTHAQSGGGPIPYNPGTGQNPNFPQCPPGQHWDPGGAKGGGGARGVQAFSGEGGACVPNDTGPTPTDPNAPPTPPPGTTPFVNPSTAHPEWFDTNISPEQWQAWEKDKMAGCPPNMPYKGRAGQCASKPDDCPEGTQVVGNDTAGNARCVPSNALPGQQGGGGATPPGAAPVTTNPNQLIPGTDAPQLGYYGALGNMGPLIQAIIGLSGGGQ